MNAKKLSSCLIVVLVAACSVFWASCTSESPKLQQVAIVELTNVTTTSFECLVKVNPNGSSTIVERGVLYDTKEWKGEKFIKSDSNSDLFSVKIENLLSGTYHGVRAYARTDKGVVVYSALVAVATPIAQGEVTDIEGNVYKTIKIGTQEWMVENLRTTKYNTGTSITKPVSKSAWNDNKNGAYTLYTGADKAVHGYLYNGSAVRRVLGSVDNFLLPPAGWRVPTVKDWEAFQEYLVFHGHGAVDDDRLVGMALASNSLWKASTELETIGFDLTQNNKTGFGAVPAGFCFDPTAFNKGVGVGEGAYFWTSEDVPNVIDQLLYFVSLSYDNGQLNLKNAELNAKYPGASVRANGLSVRCMRDIK